jgi:hypothetical protein
MKLANTPQTVINKKSNGTLISGVKTEVCGGKGGPVSLTTLFIENLTRNNVQTDAGHHQKCNSSIYLS